MAGPGFAVLEMYIILEIILSKRMQIYKTFSVKRILTASGVKLIVLKYLKGANFTKMYKQISRALKRHQCR